MTEPDPCIRNCGRVATVVVTRIADGRARPYCTECAAEAIEVFADVIIVDPISIPTS